MREPTEANAHPAEEERIKRVAVQSSNIASIGYDATRYVLEIEFRQGGVYQYARVPSHLHQGLMDADSKGSYFLRFIRDRYATIKISDADS